MSCLLSFHGRCAGPASVRKFSQSLTAGRIADAAGAALLIFRRAIVLSPLPFLASEVLGIISRSATLLCPVHYFLLGLGYDRLLEKIALRGECREDLAMMGWTVCSGLILLMYENKRSMFWTNSGGSWLNGMFGKSFMICLATRNLEKLTPLFSSSASTYLRICTSFASASLPKRFLPSSTE